MTNEAREVSEWIDSAAEHSSYIAFKKCYEDSFNLKNKQNEARFRTAWCMGYLSAVKEEMDANGGE